MNSDSLSSVKNQVRDLETMGGNAWPWLRATMRLISGVIRGRRSRWASRREQVAGRPPDER